MKNARIFRALTAFYGYSLRKKILIIGLAGMLGLLLISLLTFAWFARDIADRERLMNRNNTGIRLLDKDGRSFYTFGRVKEQNDIKLDQISDNIERALVASEDKDFYEHGGFSIRGIGGAIVGNALNRDATAYGGSTITQQLVKNNLLSDSKTFLRKYQELSIAIAVDRNYTKDEILEMYLNSVYYGEGAFGIDQAAKVYFNKTPQELSLAESSLLIGILPAPSAYSPISGDPAKAERQQQRVLNRMASLNYISQSEADTALQEQLTYGTGLDATNTHAQHFSEMVINELNKRYGEERVTRSGFEVTTSLQLDWQKAAEQQVKTRVAQLSAQGGRNASVVAVDPGTGAVRALVGSADWNNEQFGKVNMALTPRQPGSSFKPIYFAEAMDRKLISPATILRDTPRTFGSYAPENYDFKYAGNITARKALAQSRNLTAIEVMEKLGIDDSITEAQQMGLKTINGTSQQYGLALALGTAETPLMDMTNAYAAYANGGNQFDPTTIISIKDKFGKTIYDYAPIQKEVQSPEASYLISSVLSDVQARGPTFSSLNIPGKSVAVKTGTTNDNHDAWTIGYTPGIAVGVWVGNNENQAMTGVAGASGAGPIWRATMERILSDIPSRSFARPANVEAVSICSANGRRALTGGSGTYTEYFIAGTGPRETCNAPQPVEKPKDDTKKKQDDKPEDTTDQGTDEDTTTPATPPQNQTPTPTPQPLAACNDKLDNDGDGKIDAADSGCTDTTDNDETNTPTPTTPVNPVAPGRL
ncbi:MAG TPA: PBP1A family penicillin-binding protein [Candidatus Saccharimonadales bacterium]|jgi:penicillin-binding protein 1A